MNYKIRYKNPNTRREECINSNILIVTSRLGSWWDFIGNTIPEYVPKGYGHSHKH